MNGLNFPLTIDLFNGILSGVIISVTAGIINARIKNEITGEKAAANFAGLAIIAVLLFIIWYNIVGYGQYRLGLRQEQASGCGNAIYTYETAINWNPKISDLRWQFVECAVQLQRIETTIISFEKQKDKLVNDPVYWQQLSYLYLKSNKFEKMREALIILTDMNPPDLEQWTDFIGWELMNNMLYVEAESTMRVFRRSTTNRVAIYWLAWSLYEQGNYADALAHFDSCIKEYEPSGNVQNLGRCYAGKGFVYLDTGYTLDAKAAFIQAISVQPDQQDVKDALLQMP